MGKTRVSKTLHCQGNSFKCNPHPGQYLMHAYSHIMQAVVAIDSCSTLIGVYHYGITIGSKNRENLCLKDPLLRWVVQSIPLSTSSTQHMWKLLVGNLAWQFSHHIRREVGSWVGVCVPLALSLSYQKNSELNCSTA